MKTMTMQDRQTLASRYAAGENVTQIAVDLGMSAAAVYAELRRGYTGGLDGNGDVQFSTAAHLDEAAPTDKQFAAVGQALYGEPVLPMDVVFFSTAGENSRTWGAIGGHIFCYQYERE